MAFVLFNSNYLRRVLQITAVKRQVLFGRQWKYIKSFPISEGLLKTSPSIRPSECDLLKNSFKIPSHKFTEDSKESNTMEVDKFLSSLIGLSNSHDMSERELFAILNDKFKSLNDLQFLKILENLASLPSKWKWSRHLYEDLDQQCLSCFNIIEEKTVSFKALTSLLEANPPQFIHLTFHRKIVDYWAPHIHLLTATEFVTFLKFTQRDRKLPVNLHADTLEECLNKLLDQLSIEDVGSVCESLFMCQHGLKSVNLMDRIATKVVENVDSISNRMLGAILKIFRKSNVVPNNYSQKVLDLQSILKDYVHLWPPMTLIVIRISQ